jgi:hypothetical protein
MEFGSLRVVYFISVLDFEPFQSESKITIIIIIIIIIIILFEINAISKDAEF